MGISSLITSVGGLILIKSNYKASLCVYDVLFFILLAPSERLGTGLIHTNFSRDLIRLFNEMQYWERLRFEVPHYAAEIYKQCESLRVLRENVLLVVRDYNRILYTLDTKERALFRERIKSFDKKILPGMTKLTWASQNTDIFISECRNHAQKVSVAYMQLY